MRFTRRLILLALLTPALAQAQVVRGVVVEKDTGTPLAGAMAILLRPGAEDAAVARVLTDAAGGFTLRAPDSGRYSIRVDRIGYASLTTEPFDILEAGAFRRVEVPIQPVRLIGLDVEGDRRCEIRLEEGLATARVWDEARKSLEAAAWTLESGLYHYTLLRFERELDREGLRIENESRRFTRGSTYAPFVSAPIEALIESGFVQEDSDSTTIWHAPDAEAFLSRAFLDTHCMGVRRGGPGMIGLAFEPIEGRIETDIAGTLWLDETTAELSRLAFEYVNLGRSDLGEPGGEVVFTRLPTGAWIVREWRIRMPLMGLRGRRPFRFGYREGGGVAWRVTDAEGNVVLEAATASVSGVVTDSVRPGPPADPVRVEVVGSGDGETTNPDGSFLLAGLPEGGHRIRVRHPLLDSLRVAPPSVTVQSALGEVVHATLRVPTLAEALADPCGGAPRPRGSAPILGRVVSRGGATVEGVAVELAWLQSRFFQPAILAMPAGPAGEEEGAWTPGADGAYATVATETDSRGIFVLCDVPHGSRLRWSVTTPAGAVLTGSTTMPYGATAFVETIIIEEGS